MAVILTGNSVKLKAVKKWSENLFYKLFVTLYVIGVAVFIYLKKTGRFFLPKTPEVMPSSFAHELRYPPNGCESSAVTTILVLIGIYLIIDLFLMQKLKWHWKLLSSLAFVLILFGTTETVISRNMNTDTGFFHRPSPYFIWELLPGLKTREFSTNRYSMRYGDFPVKKPAGEYRIILIGDSSAFGFRLNDGERFSDILEKKLNAKYPDKKVRVINAAVEGYSTFQMARLYDKKLKTFEPDCIIMSVNNDPALEAVPDNCRLPSPVIRPVMGALYKSLTYLTLRKIVLNYNIKTCSIPAMKPNKTRVSLKDSVKNQRGIIEDMKKRHKKTVIINMPTRTGSVDPDSLRYKDAARKLAESTGTYYVDTLEEWKRRSITGNEYFLDNVHPGINGNKILADDLFEFFIKNMII